jgi:hypothetical protein
MGVNQLPEVKDYWKSTCTTVRLQISRYIHFVDNSTLQPRGSPGYNRLGKVRPIIDHLSMKFMESYYPHKEVAVDEAMIAKAI